MCLLLESGGKQCRKLNQTISRSSVEEEHLVKKESSGNRSSGGMDGLLVVCLLMVQSPGSLTMNHSSG
jgi:hypothetical protein